MLTLYFISSLSTCQYLSQWQILLYTTHHSTPQHNVPQHNSAYLHQTRVIVDKVHHFNFLSHPIHCLECTYLAITLHTLCQQKQHNKPDEPNSRDWYCPALLSSFLLPFPCLLSCMPFSLDHLTACTTVLPFCTPISPVMLLFTQPVSATSTMITCLAQKWFSAHNTTLVLFVKRR